MKSIVEKRALVERMHLLIKRRGTGTPRDFANRLNLSKASLHRHIEIMKELGAPIVYNIRKQSYEYSYDVEFHFGFLPMKLLSDVDANRINGGLAWQKLNKFSTFFSRLKI